jgi:radical SAM superfamily enzyme YgiQ (UPF0313 family)
MKKRIMLLYPNFNWAESINRTKWLTHPYNLGLLAATIEDKYDVNIIDANLDNLTPNDFAKVLEYHRPNVLGISLATNEYTESGLIAAKIAKESNPETKVVVGGISAISNPTPLIKNSYIDSVVVGEGEYVFKGLCDFFYEQGEFPKKGVLLKERGKITGQGRVDFIHDLDSLPLPSYNSIDFNRYTHQIQREAVDRPRDMPYARIITSRGCPFNCCFCQVGSISGKKLRLRGLEKIAEEIEWLISDYGIKALSFDDDNLTAEKQRAKDLFKIMIDRKYNLKWNDPATAIFTLDDEMLDLMKESGCQYLGVAIESGNQRVERDIVHKPINLKKAKKTIEKIKQRGIDLAVNFITGFPGETWDEIRETYKFAEEIDVDYVRLFIATPLPDTDLYRMAKEGGYIRKGFEFNKHLWTDGWLECNEFRHQDLKILRAYEWDRINFSSQKKIEKIAQMMNISIERLNEIRKDSLKRANP